MTSATTRIAIRRERRLYNLRVAGWVAALGFIGYILLSGTVAGFCARAAFIVPVYWAGELSGHPIMSEAAAQAAVLWHLF